MRTQPAHTQTTLSEDLPLIGLFAAKVDRGKISCEVSCFITAVVDGLLK